MKNSNEKPLAIYIPKCIESSFSVQDIGSFIKTFECAMVPNPERPEP